MVGEEMGCRRSKAFRGCLTSVGMVFAARHVVVEFLAFPASFWPVENPHTILQYLLSRRDQKIQESPPLDAE
jgi:hypothetical protein